MWNRRKEEEYVPKPAAPPSSADLAKEGIPVSTMPVRTFESDGSRNSAAIGKSVVIKGQVYSREDLLVDGELEGTVELQEHKLTVGPNGKVSATVKAREIVVLGTVHGNVEAGDRIEIRKEAKLVGDIKTARIIIEDGAYFKGSIDILKPEVGKPAALRPPAAVAPAPAGLGAAATPEMKR